jgi:hypothetical protein
MSPVSITNLADEWEDDRISLRTGSVRQPTAPGFHVHKISTRVTDPDPPRVGIHYPNLWPAASGSLGATPIPSYGSPARLRSRAPSAPLFVPRRPTLHAASALLHTPSGRDQSTPYPPAPHPPPRPRLRLSPPAAGSMPALPTLKPSGQRALNADRRTHLPVGHRSPGQIFATAITDTPARSRSRPRLKSSGLLTNARSLPPSFELPTTSKTHKRKQIIPIRTLRNSNCSSTHSIKSYLG